MVPNKRKIYYPDYEQWKRITTQTEFAPNEDVSFAKVYSIDFNESNVYLKSGKAIPFDCLSEAQYVWVSNGGYYEDAPEITDRF